MAKPKYLRFSKFLGDRDASADEAQRLLKLKKEIRRLKRQRLIFVAGACGFTAALVYLVAR